MALDHTQDLSGTDTHRLITLYPPPAFVKSAGHDALHGDPETLPSHVYADQLNRLYPAHTGAATWLSTAFFMDKRAELDPLRAELIESRLDQAAAFHGVKGLTDELKQKMAADAVDGMNKLADADFALIWDIDGAKDRHYPLRNSEEVKTAAAWFEKYRDEFLFDDRRQIADKILARADHYQVSLPNKEMLTKTAGYGHCAASEIVSLLTTRADMTQRSFPEESAQLRKVAAAVEANPVDARDGDFRLKLAGEIDKFDRLTRLNKMYGDGGLDRAEDVLFAVTEKTAREFLGEHVTTTSGAVYEKAALNTLPLDLVREWMGDDFAEEVTVGGLFVDAEKTATVLATLPRGDAEMFERMAAAADIHPYARDKAAADEGLSLEELAALADAHNTAAPLEPNGAFTSEIASILD